jgi:hypothetical protein
LEGLAIQGPWGGSHFRLIDGLEAEKLGAAAAHPLFQGGAVSKNELSCVVPGLEIGGTLHLVDHAFLSGHGDGDDGPDGEDGHGGHHALGHRSSSACQAKKGENPCRTESWQTGIHEQKAQD